MTTRYVQWQDVVNRYSDVGKVSGGATIVKDSYINGAEAVVDAACARLYTVPFNPVPDLIKDVVIDLAYLRAVIRQDPKTTKMLRDDVTARLSGIACGSLCLVVSGTNLAPAAPGDVAFSTTENFGSSFGVDDPINWSVSSNWQEFFDNQRC